jgi:exosortase/archaeosortase family protein
MTSAALAFGLAFVINRPIWERLVIVISAVPIALLTNVFRITLTGLAFEFFGPEVAEKVFHDLAGWLMMPMAVGLLWLEMTILSNMTIEPQQGSSLAGALLSRESMTQQRLSSQTSGRT